MNDLLKALWIVAKVFILVSGVGAILAGGICGAILLPGALGHDSYAKSFIVIAGIVFVVGLALAIPAWKSLRREHLAAKARQAAALDEIGRRNGPLP